MDDEFWAVVMVASVVGLIAMVTGGVISYNTCHSQWGRSGYSVEWGPIQGCMIEVKPNVWLPSKNLREIPLQDSK